MGLRVNCLKAICSACMLNVDVTHTYIYRVIYYNIIIILGTNCYFMILHLFSEKIIKSVFFLIQFKNLTVKKTVGNIWASLLMKNDHLLFSEFLRFTFETCADIETSSFSC